VSTLARNESLSPTIQASASPRISVVWVVVNTVHYHLARWQAVSDLSEFKANLLAITQKDEVDVLQAKQGKGSSYSVDVLFKSEPPKSRRAVSSALKAALDKMNPDVVCLNGWSLYGSWEALNWCVQNNRKAILMSETNERDASRNRFAEAVKSRFVQSCSAALVGGTKHADYLTKLGMTRDRIYLGYDAVDNEHFSSGAAAARKDPESVRKSLNLPTRYILASARFTPKKNLGFLIASYAEYRRQAGPAAAKLVILGDGQERPVLEKLRSEMGLENMLEMPGFRSYELMPAYYALAELFVHASSTEQWGLVINEAMASGTPVLVSSACGAADLVQEGITGYTFDVRDRSALARLMFNLMQDKTRRAALAFRAGALISEWGPNRFAVGLLTAIHRAFEDTARRKIVDRILTATLSRL
jgi:glycosyltransferase involved in cell wall biosynthesis